MVPLLLLLFHLTQWQSSERRVFYYLLLLLLLGFCVHTSPCLCSFSFSRAGPQCLTSNIYQCCAASARVLLSLSLFTITALWRLFLFLCFRIGSFIFLPTVAVGTNSGRQRQTGCNQTLHCASNFHRIDSKAPPRSASSTTL